MIKGKRKNCTVRVKALKLRFYLNKSKTMIEFYKTNPMILAKNIAVTIALTIVSYLIGGILGAVIGCVLGVIVLLFLDSHRIKHIESS